MKVAKESYPFIAIASVLVLLAYYLSVYLTLPFILLLLFVIYFFRDPERYFEGDENKLISPADGKIIEVLEQTEDKQYLNGPCKKVVIFMSPFNVHVNRVPIDGEVEEVRYTSGKYLMAMKEKASLDNERNAVLLKTKSGAKIAFVQIAGFLARRIVCYVSKSQNLTRGCRYGLIRFGSRVDLYLPTSSKVLVQLGEVVKAGETVIAELN